jgi:hypothetical protein
MNAVDALREVLLQAGVPPEDADVAAPALIAELEGSGQAPGR